WQMGGLGPMAGQAHHFRHYAPRQIKYAVERYTNEVNRLYGVMNARLEANAFLAGRAYTIADMACIGWSKPYQRQGQGLADFPHLKRWFDTIMARPAVKRGLDVGAERRHSVSIAKDKEAFRILFGQRAP